MSGPSGLIEKRETEEDLEDKPNEKNPIMGEVIPDSKLQTDTIHTNQPLYVAAGRSVMIEVKCFDRHPFVKIEIDGIASIIFFKHFNATIYLDPPLQMRIEMKEPDVFRVTIYDVMGYFGKEIIFYQNNQQSIPFKIYELTEANDPDYLKTNEHHRSLLECCCPYIWIYRHLRERNQVFLFDDQSNVRRLKETKEDHKPDDENKPHNENKPDDENKPEEEKTETSDSGPEIIRVTTVPKGPGPKRL